MSMIQILVILFAVIAFIATVIKYRENKITLGEFIFWSIIWVAMGIIAYIPYTTTAVARILGVQRGIDVPIYISIVLLFYLVFKIYSKMEKVEREITKLVREEAIRKRKR